MLTKLSIRVLELEIVNGRVTRQRVEGVTIQELPTEAEAHACPRCGVEPGVRCRTANGYPSSITHAARGWATP